MKITHRIPWNAPYAYTEIEYEDTDENVALAEAIEEARVAEALAFPAAAQRAPYEPGEPERVADPEDNRQPARRVAQRAPGGPQQAGNAYGVVLTCPIHPGAVLQPSVKNKNMDWIDELGRDIPASWFHTGPDGKSCSTYQSKAVWPQAASR